MGTLNRLINRGMAEEGYIEKSSNIDLDSKTGNRGDGNYTKYSRDVNAWGLMGCQGQPWCCTMQFALEGYEYGPEIALEHWNMTKSTYVGYNCFSTYNAFKKAGKVGMTPELGAVVIFSFSHAGRVIRIYSKNGQKWWDCLEGNTSSNLSERNGGQVRIKARPWSDPSVKGFCYIDYAEGKTGWTQEDGGWRFYIGTSEKYIAQDWYQDGYKWYYFNDQGFMMYDAWIFYKNKWYYFNSDGSMARNQWIIWKGQLYRITVDGSMFEGKMILNTDERGALE